MLNPEAARAQLREWRSSEIQRSRFHRLSKLRTEWAEAVYGMHGLLRDEKRPLHWRESIKLRDSAVTRFHEDPKGRVTVFHTRFPTITDDLERGWQLIARTPYTMDDNRRPFRVPTRPDLYLRKRAHYLTSVFEVPNAFPDDILSAEWLAAWAVHLEQAYFLGYLLAGAIDAGSESGGTVFEILKDTAAGRHEIGGPCRAAITGLLAAFRADGWEFVEQLLLAAQRQEGLRQVILESVDEAHPHAFP